MSFSVHVSSFPPQAQKSIDDSIQKLRLLKMSLENRLEEFPNLADALKDQEQNGEGIPPVFPRPTPLTGTLYIKLLGVEGLLDIHTLRMISGNDLQPMSPPRTYSGTAILKNTARFMTLPTPSHRDREREKEKEREREDEGGLSSSTGPGSGSSLHWPTRKGSRHVKSSKATTLQKQHSLDHIADDSCTCSGYGSCRVMIITVPSLLSHLILPSLFPPSPLLPPSSPPPFFILPSPSFFLLSPSLLPLLPPLPSSPQILRLMP